MFFHFKQYLCVLHRGSSGYKRMGCERIARSLWFRYSGSGIERAAGRETIDLPARRFPHSASRSQGQQARRGRDKTSATVAISARRAGWARVASLKWETREGGPPRSSAPRARFRPRSKPTASTVLISAVGETDRPDGHRRRVERLTGNWPLITAWDSRAESSKATREKEANKRGR